MKKDINWMLIESVVRRTVQKLHDSPEREIRNLIDLGLSFADGRFQRKFLKASQKMLRNEKSAYYPLIKDVVSHVDEERLVTFGMNLGYQRSQNHPTNRAGGGLQYSLGVKLLTEPCPN